MSRIHPVDRDTPDEGTRRNFAAIEQLLGSVPGSMRTMAHSPAVLGGYLGLSGALRRGLLPGGLQEQIALAIAEANGCDYCLSAHAALGARAGLSPEQIDESRDGHAAEAKAAAALRFARALLDRRGDVTDAQLAEVRAAGFADGELAEIVAHVALNVFTNYFNRAARTDIDFPPVHAGVRIHRGVTA